ncbi:ig family protein [Pectobacterium actinidiae]|nr:ig family protein [Pectobacterium actinidiae]
MLEARMMFDGAVTATVNQADNAQSTPEANPTVAADSNDAPHAGDGTQTQNSQADHADSHDDTSGTSDIAVAGETVRKEVVFIDTSVTDYQTLVDNVPAGIEVELFDGSKDGLSQLVQWAQNHSGYDAIHILSHGSEGEIQLGSLTLDSDTANARATDLATLGAALTDSGDLLIYGCDVAQDSGQSFVTLLAQLTGADVAASSDTTGASVLGGDWSLENHSGDIETSALQIDGYRHTLDVSGTTVDFLIDGFAYSTGTVGSSVELFLDGGLEVDSSNWYADIDPVTSTITMTMRNGIYASDGLTSFDFTFSGGTLLAITSITKDNAATTSAADFSATVTGTDNTITFHVNTNMTSGDGVLVWHFTSTNSGQPTDTTPTAMGSGTNPTFTENGTAVSLFTGISADTQDSGQTFSGATFTVSNVAGSTEYLTLHGINVALSNGNSVSLGSGYGSASVSVSGGIATVSISGATLSNSDMGSLLSGITYGNSSDNPGNATRTVTLTQLTDSGTSNNTVAPNISSAITVVPVNDAPTDITLSNTVFGQSLGSNGTVASLSATDVDSNSFTYSLVSGSGSTDNALFTLSGNQLHAVDATTMAAGTYSIRLQVSDGQATYDKVVTLTVTDDIAPSFDQSPAVANATPSGFDLSGSVSEAGNVYYVVVADGASAPTAAQVIAGQTANGAAATASGSQVLNSAPYDFSFTLTGLAASTLYDVYVVAKDSNGNNTVSVVKIDASTTSAGTAPTLSAHGSNPVFIGGMAGSVDLFGGVTANTNDSGQTFTSLTLTVSNVTDSGEFINIGGNNISLSANSTGTLTGIGSYSVTRVAGTVTVQLTGMSANNTEVAGLVDGMRYGNSSASVTAAARAVTLSAISDSGSSNNSAALNVTSSVNVQASNSALYVTSGDDTGSDAAFGSSLQDDVNDGGGLSLREALYWANNTAGIDRIVFQTDVTLASSVLTPTETLLIDGQSFKLNGGGYSGFQIVTSSITLAIQNLTLTNFTTDYSTDSGGILGIAPGISNVNFRLYNVDISGNRDTNFGNGVIDLYNLGPGTNNFDLDRVTIHDNILFGGLNQEGVIKLFVSGTQQTVSLSITNSAIHNNTGANQGTTSFGIAGLWLIANGSNPTATHVSLMNTTITGQDSGIIFEFTNNATQWVADLRNSLITGNTIDVAGYNDVNQASGSYTLYGSNNIIGGSVDKISATDPRLASSASNAINQGSRFLVTGDTDIRGMDRVRQGNVDIGAYESQFASGTAPQVDLNGSDTGNDYSATVSSSDVSNGVAIADALATLSQTDGDSRIWTMTLSLTGVLDSTSESLSLSPSARLTAHAVGINVTSDGQTLTLTGGATQEAFQTVLRAIVYVNVAVAPSAGVRTISVTVNDDASSSATSTLTIVTGNPPVVATPIPAQSVAQDGGFSFTVPAGTFTDPDGDTLTLSATLANGSPLPAWLSFNPATGTFSGTPGNADVGSLSIKVTATDTTNASVSTSFSLTVNNVNDAPVVATPIPAQSVAQDGSFSFIVPAGTFTDPDGDTLTLSATLADGSALPGWLSFNAATGTFSGTPGNGDVGNLSIKVTATDTTNASVSTTFGLTVTNVNDAPVVATPIPAQSVAQDGSLNFTVPTGTFTDPDGDTLTLSATLADGSPLPAWLSFNPATGTFSGTPGNGDVGSLSIKITATDPNNAAISTTFSLTVSNVNDAPVLATPIPAQSVAQDGSLNFTIPAGTFTDPDGDTLTLSATLADGSPLPAWLSFNPATGTFSGTPGNGDVGNLSIKVTATDTTHASVSTSFSLTVTNVNDAPVVSGTLPPQSVAQDGSFSFTVPAGTFTDPDGDTLTLSATLADGSPLPAWLSFNPATGTFSGTPGNADVGSLSIKVTATDTTHASVSTTFGLTVTNVNDAPVVSGTLPPQSVAQDGGFSFTVPAGTFTDPDGDTLTLSATLADGSPLPTWLSFNPATGTFSGTPGNADVGSLSIKITATDTTHASVSTTFGLTVTNVNDAPVLATPIPPQSVAQDGGFSFTVPAGTFTDPDGDPLTLSATLANGSPLPAWLSFNPATGTFSGTPGNADVGSLSIKITATDTTHASVSTTFGLTVTNVNDAPVLATPIPPQSVAQDGGFSFTVPAGTFTDPDGDTLTLSATLANGSPLPAWLSFNPATGTFSGTPGNADVGSLSIKITATDPSSAAISTTFGLTVSNVNDAPIVATPIPAQSVAQDGGFSFTVPAGTFTDPDGDTLTLNATLADGSPLPAWLSFNPATGTFSGTPGNDDVGSLSIKLTATDPSSTAISTTFALTVTNTNDAPVVSGAIPPQSVTQDGGFSFTVPAGTFTDPDGDTLTLSATLADGSPLPAWLSFNPATGTFSGTPGNGDVGSLSIKLTANDGDTSVSTTFALTVTNTNDAPVVSGTLPPQSVTQDGGFSFTVPAGTFTDPDGDTLTLSATLANGSPLPTWLSFNPATGTFSGTPGNADVGSLSIKLTANDGDTSVSTTFALTVTNTNDAPVVSGTLPPQSVAQDGGFSFTVPAGTFSDPDGDTLTLSATLANGSPLPAWLSFNPATSTFSGTPGNADVGSLSIKVTATDTTNASVSTTFGLTVTNVNDAPVVSGTLPPQSVTQDGGFSFTVPAGTFTDPDGDTLTLSATQANGSPLPAWLSFNPATGTFSGMPGNGDVGSLSIKITATDPNNAAISTTFGLTVTNVNDAPVVATPIPAQSVSQDGSLNFTVPAGTFTDPDGDTLTLSATLANGSPLPAWLSFNPATGTFSGTPGNGDVGSLSIKITATDPNNAAVSTTFGLTVTNVNDAPVVSGTLPPQSVAQDGGFSFTVPAGTFTDPDGDTLTLSATLADGSPLPAWLSFNPATGTFSGTPGNADVGSLSIKITATDTTNASVSTTFGLTVTNVNDAPVVSGTLPPQSVTQDGGFSFTVPAGTFTDPDGDTLTLSATQANGSPLPAWLSFNPATGTFSGTPGNADVGSLSIKITATDPNNAAISTTFALTVTRTEIAGGDPQFRVSDGATSQQPGRNASTFFPTEGGPQQTLNLLISQNSLGGFNAGRAAGESSLMSAIFAASHQDSAKSATPGSQLATTFAQSLAQVTGTRLDSSLGSFPSFSKDPVLGGTTSLASVFSGIYLPSLTPMEVFAGGSWKGVDIQSGSVQSADRVLTPASAAFTPSLHRQLQQIGEAEGQRLATIEQALHDRGQQQG